MAREADESVGYVMPRALMVELARDPPSTQSQLLATRNLSPLSSKHCDKLISIIKAAKQQAAQV